MSGLARAAPVAVAYLALSGCVYIGDFDSDRFKEDFHKTFPLEAGGTVTIENSNGSIEIFGWEQNSVEVNGTKYASTRDLLDSLQVEMNGSGNAVRIRTSRPEIHFGNAGVRYTLRVPKKVLLDRITSSNGSIRVEDVRGNATLRSSNGRIRVSRLTGNVDAETSNGMIEVRDLEGNANLHTSNGAIDAEAAKGTFEAHTSNGRIEARLQDPAEGRAIRLESSNGHIELRLDGALHPDVRARTSNSSVTLFLPPETNARVHARTTHGSVTSDFDNLRHESGHREQDLDGTIGNGGPLIELESTNGAIKVLRR